MSFYFFNRIFASKQFSHFRILTSYHLSVSGQKYCTEIVNLILSLAEGVKTEISLKIFVVTQEYFTIYSINVHNTEIQIHRDDFNDIFERFNVSQ